MTGEETQNLMEEIALKKAERYQSQMVGLDSTRGTEKKALAISKQIAENCACFTKIDFMNHYYEIREKRVFGQDFHDFDEWKSDYDALSGDDRDSFLVFSFAIIMVRHCLLNRRKEKLSAKINNGDVQKQFEDKLIVGVLEDILKAWQKFWDERGCIQCRVIK